MAQGWPADISIGEAAEKRLGALDLAKDEANHWPTRSKLPATPGQKALAACRERKAKGLTQKAAGELFGTQGGAVSLVERAIMNDPTLEEEFASSFLSPEQGYGYSLMRKRRR